MRLHRKVVVILQIILGVTGIPPLAILVTIVVAKSRLVNGHEMLMSRVFVVGIV